MSRAKLWEDTVVIAMRDIQWMMSISLAVSQQAPSNEFAKLSKLAQTIPPGFLKLDGRAESTLGDVALKKNERFFLFEVKSTRNDIRSEWRSDGKYSPKMLLTRLSELVSLFNGDPGNAAVMDMIGLSLRGHFLAYWGGSEVDSKVRGAIVSEAYISACSSNRKADDIARGEGMPMPVNYSNGGIYVPKEQQMARIGLLTRIIAGQYVAMPPQGLPQKNVGLTRDEFKKYVEFLCSIDSGGKGFILESDSDRDRSHEPLHAVSLSTYGSHFKVIADTAELATLLDGEFRPEPRHGRNIKIQGSIKPAVPPIG